MKVYEVINEVWYNPATWGKGADTAKTATKAVFDQRAYDRAVANINKNPKAYLAAIDARIQSGQLAADLGKVESTWQTKIGKFWTILKVLNFAAACIQLLYHLHIVEQDYNDGKLNQGEFVKWREWYIGLWEVQVALPVIMTVLKAAMQVTMLTRFIVSIIELLGSVATLGGALLGFASTQLLSQAIMAFLQTPAAQDWLMKHFLEPIVMLGSIGDDAWLILYKAIKGENYYDAKAKEKEKINPAAAARDKEQAVNAAPDAKTGKNSVVVGGVRITDENGYLLPYADSWGAVRDAIKYNPKEKAKYDAVAAKGKAPSTGKPGDGSFDSM